MTIREHWQDAMMVMARDEDRAEHVYPEIMQRHESLLETNERYSLIFNKYIAVAKNVVKDEKEIGRMKLSTWVRHALRERDMAPFYDVDDRARPVSCEPE